MYGLIRRGCALGTVAFALVLAGCGSTPMNRAPVEDRSANGKPAAAAGVPVVKPAPGFENAGKPGYYTVKPGDTLIRIGLENGQSPKDIARWNALENPNKIEVGQVVRVVPPTSTDSAAVAVAKPVSNGTATSTAIAPAASSTVSAAPASAASKPASSPAVVAAPVAGTAAVGDDDLGWIWPAKGAVLTEFDEVKNKGLDIGGTAGDAVLASAEGKVVYAGEGLRGYGKLIILKHNNTFLTAYAHNQNLLVKEDQTVKKGQKIAEMGNTDADRVKLHFEVRRQGKPVDPAKYLPAK
jgi:lipoprotein NlpD